MVNRRSAARAFRGPSRRRGQRATVDAYRLVDQPRAQVEQVPQQADDLGAEQVLGGDVTLLRGERDDDHARREDRGRPRVHVDAIRLHLGR